MKTLSFILPQLKVVTETISRVDSIVIRSPFGCLCCSVLKRKIISLIIDHVGVLTQINKQFPCLIFRLQREKNVFFAALLLILRPRYLNPRIESYT